MKELEKDIKLIDQFEAFINKIDTTCGGLIGDGDGIIYEKVTVTEYKKENKSYRRYNWKYERRSMFYFEI